MNDSESRNGIVLASILLDCPVSKHRRRGHRHGQLATKESKESERSERDYLD